VAEAPVRSDAYTDMRQIGLQVGGGDPVQHRRRDVVDFVSALTVSP
jgi:hypothetical protein